MGRPNTVFLVLPPPSIYLNSFVPSTDDTIGDLKKLIAAQTGTRWNKIVLKKCFSLKDVCPVGTRFLRTTCLWEIMKSMMG
uniref:Ubiquitin-like protein 5 n=1 Tax=Cricetulus griseus TaxID=10029 RepID=A0A8C2MWA2_CRIGR